MTEADKKELRERILTMACRNIEEVEAEDWAEGLIATPLMYPTLNLERVIDCVTPFIESIEAAAHARAIRDAGATVYKGESICESDEEKRLLEARIEEANVWEHISSEGEECQPSCWDCQRLADLESQLADITARMKESKND